MRPCDDRLAVRSTPALLVVFVLVLHRWVEMQSGWPEWLEFPIVGIAGTVLIDRLILPPEARLTRSEWGANLAVAVAVGVVLFAVSR
jgi:hypothetical protein